MTTDQKVYIDATMLAKYGAKPVGEWFSWALDSTEVRCYSSAHQRFHVEFRPDTGVVAVYSFAAEFKV